MTWPLLPCPRPLPPCWQQNVCWSEAMPGTLPTMACDVTTDSVSDKSSDWLRGFVFLTFWELPSRHFTDIEIKLIITLIECNLSFLSSIADQLHSQIIQETRNMFSAHIWDVICILDGELVLHEKFFFTRSKVNFYIHI